MRMEQPRQTGQAYFGTLLQTVVGQAFAAAGYQLERSPLQSAGGRFRYVKDLGGGARGIIDFQVLVYSDTLWSSGASSRFRVQLTRAPLRDLSSNERDGSVVRSLSRLVVGRFRRQYPAVRRSLVELQRYRLAGQGIGRSGTSGRWLWHALAVGRVDAARRLVFRQFA